MARLGTIYLGGRQAKDSLQHNTISSAVAFHLSEPAALNRLYQSEDGIWEVEAKWNQSCVVARSREVLDRQDILRIGFEQIQRALDIASFQSAFHATVSSPGDWHVILFLRGGDLIVQHVGVLDYGVRSHGETVALDKEGNRIPEKPSPPSQWSPPLRYFRLSQTASDLYEAYRNLFLGLESLLHSICQRDQSEGERHWLLRAFRSVGNTVDLQQFVPVGTKDPADYIVESQYKGIRCRLFHAKDELPATHQGTLNPEDVAAAYEQLVRLWRAIAQKHLCVRGSREIGAMTYGGFRRSMDDTYSRDFGMFYTDDAAPASWEDKEVSPSGRPVHPFDQIRYLAETSPGHASFQAIKRIGPDSNPTKVHRICSVEEGRLGTVHFVADGLYLDDVDIFESLLTWRLVNLGLPRTSFETETVP